MICWEEKLNYLWSNFSHALAMVVKDILQKLANSVGYRVIRYNDPIISLDLGFMRIYRKCRDFTMTSMEAMYSLHKAVNTSLIIT